MSIKVIGFDADDTLWVNENYFREAETAFCALLSDFLPEDEVMKVLYDIELQNLPIYGFGIKGFMLSMVESVNAIAGEKANPQIFKEIISLGQEMLSKPVELLDNVEDILKKLKPDYRLILVTKGDLMDQQRKLENSQLEQYFHHVEIMSNKHDRDYEKLIKHLDIDASEFLMVGNSLKSDVLPVINIGGKAIYVPYEITWQHETTTYDAIKDKEFTQVNNLSEILKHL